VNSEPNLIAAKLHHRYLDAVTDDDTLTDFSRQDEHGCFLAGFQQRARAVQESVGE
jgi:hypothetical protein